MSAASSWGVRGLKGLADWRGQFDLSTVPALVKRAMDRALEGSLPVETATEILWETALSEETCGDIFI